MTNEKKYTVINPIKGRLRGSSRVPGDKSISHRAVLFSAMAQGVSRVKGLLDSEDIRASLAAVQNLGAHVTLEKKTDGSLAGGIEGWGRLGPTQPSNPIDCRNSGTTARLLMGVLAPWDIRVKLIGDASLSKRPMRRITAPLMKMGVQFEPPAAETLPLIEVGSPHLKALTYDAPMSSAQLKTAVLLAGVYADGTTTYNEPTPSRNHTELMLPEYGIPTTAATRTASVTGPLQLKSCEIQVPGDPSSAAFLCCAAILREGSAVQIEGVSLNTARTGFVRTLERMGAAIDTTYIDSAGKEPFGIISARYTPRLRGCEIPASHIAEVIDELPVLALVAAHAQGITVFRETGELRAKEADRLGAIVEGLGSLGIDAWVRGDDLYIEGQPNFSISENVRFDSRGDHRLAMTWALVGLCKDVPVEVSQFECIRASYPNFLEDIGRLVQ